MKAFHTRERSSPFRLKRVPGEGPVPARIMLLGERPGQHEAERGRPFVGLAGDILNTMLAAANLDRKKIYITNLVKDFQQYAKPTAADLVECGPEVEAEINRVQPEIIGCLGTYAVEWILGRERAELERTHGVPVQWTNGFDSAIVLPMFHPAAGIYSPETMAVILDDFLTLAKLQDGEIEVRQDQHKGHEDYQRTDRYTIDAPVIAVDTEGSRQQPWCLTWSQIPGWARLSKDSIQINSRKVYLHNSLHDLGVLRKMGVQLGEEQFVDTMVLAYHLCVEPQGLKALAYRHCAMEMHDYSELVEQPNQDKALEFMLQIAEQEWPDPEPYLVLAKGMPKTKKPWNMKRLAMRAIADLAEGKVDKDGNYPDLRARWNKWDDEVKAPVVEVMGEMPEATLDDVDEHTAENYACRDSDATFRIGPILEQKVKDMGLERAVALDHSILPMIDRMQQVGIKLAPKEFWDRIEDKCHDQMGRAKFKVYEMTGTEINPASGDQVAELLYGQLGLTPPKYTDSGARGKVDGVTLEGLLAEAPVVQPIMDYNEANKIKGTYVEPLRRLAVKSEDGRAHATFRVTRTTTGRLSMADPPMHQIPILTDLGKELRDGFVAPEGLVLGDWDVDQLEMRTCAHDSKDPELCRLFNQGRDVHAETAAKIFSVPMSTLSVGPNGKVNDYRRIVAKHAGFGIINGITEHGLVNYMILNRCRRPDGGAWTLDDCVEILREWFKLYKGVKRFQKDCIAEAQATGLSRETISGKILYLPAVWHPLKWVRESAERLSYVHHTQGGGAALVKRAMSVMWQTVFKKRLAEPLLWVHDEILLEMKDRERQKKEVDRLMVAALCETTKLRVPVKASGGFGKTWLQAH